MRFGADINARSLGGLPLSGGGETVPGIWRSADPDPLTVDGWDEVAAAGVRRIVDLRNASERGEASARPEDVEVVRAPLEDPDDPDYTRLWDRNWAHPDFYAWGIAHWPELWEVAFEAIATAPEGAVLIHCAGGRDRTGMLSAVLLDTVGVDRGAIIRDYTEGIYGTNEMLRRRGRDDHGAAIPEDRLPEVTSKLHRGLDSFLDGLPDLLAGRGLTQHATRASRRLLP